MIIKLISYVIIIAAAGLVLAACGGSENDFTGSSPTETVLTTSPDIGQIEPDSVDVAVGDCSPSYREELAAFVPAMLSVAVDAAKQEHRFLAACFDGAPLRTLVWDPQINFAERPPNISDEVIEKVNFARALGLRSKLEAMIQTTPQRAKGSGQLELLELLAQTNGLGRAYVFTDAIFNQIDGTDLNAATQADIDQLIERWLPRMESGLEGRMVAFVGVGRGIRSTANLRKAESVFRGIVEGAGGTFIWAPDLPQLSS